MSKIRGEISSFTTTQKSENLTKVGLSHSVKVVDNLAMKIVSSLLKVKT